MHDVRRFRNSEQQVYRVLTYLTVTEMSVRRTLTILMMMFLLSASGNSHSSAVPDRTEDATALADFDCAVCNLGLFSSSDTIHTISIGLLNIGSSPFEISGTETSCSCTSVSFSDSYVIPGDSAVITVTYDATDKWPGIINQSARIRCSASNAPIDIQITGFMYDDSAGPDSTTCADWQILIEPRITKIQNH